MVREWNGSLVHVSEFEPKQPQLEPKPMNGDSISLRNIRPIGLKMQFLIYYQPMLLKRMKQDLELLMLQHLVMV